MWVRLLIVKTTGSSWYAYKSYCSFGLFALFGLEIEMILLSLNVHCQGGLVENTHVFNICFKHVFNVN